jgi:hypothetical protein
LKEIKRKPALFSAAGFLFINIYRRAKDGSRKSRRCRLKQQITIAGTEKG